MQIDSINVNTRTQTHTRHARQCSGRTHNAAPSAFTHRDAERDKYTLHERTSWGGSSSSPGQHQHWKTTSGLSLRPRWLKDSTLKADRKHTVTFNQEEEPAGAGGHVFTSLDQGRRLLNYKKNIWHLLLWLRHGYANYTHHTHTHGHTQTRTVKAAERLLTQAHKQKN